GFETARSLALHGARVILACRNLDSAAYAIARIQAEKSTVQCVAMEIDLASLRSVRQFAQEYKRRYRTLNILILNAGVFGLGFSHTGDGYETTFQVNHLSHFFLTMQLEDVLIKGAKVFARVVVVSSESHRFSQQQGAATSIYCATSLDLSLPVSGSYFNNCCRCPPSKAAQDEILANVLWKMSEDMVQDVTKQWTEEGTNSEEVVF
ncbi:hypothetical protein WDU94_011961, partial [Cyamophila willieti]